MQKCIQGCNSNVRLNRAKQHHQKLRSCRIFLIGKLQSPLQGKEKSPRTDGSKSASTAKVGCSCMPKVVVMALKLKLGNPCCCLVLSKSDEEATARAEGIVQQIVRAPHSRALRARSCHSRNLGTKVALGKRDPHNESTHVLAKVPRHSWESRRNTY